MKNYYEILDIDASATQAEIKKGYFKMVRKYSPERYPEKFMEIRNAYETLSNEKTKNEYDQVLNMPREVSINFEHAQKLIESGNNEKAINILQQLSKDFPDFLIIKSMLGEVCLKNGNTGKAINAFEGLVKTEPNNASFAGHLAKAYIERGWHKKAIDAYKRAIQLDQDNISLWIGLSEAYMIDNNVVGAKQVLHTAIEKYDGENQEVAIDIYFKLFIIDIATADISDMKANLEKLTEIAIKVEDMKEHIGWILFSVANQMIKLQMIIEAKEVLDKAEILIPEDKELKSIKAEVDIFYELSDELDIFEEDSYEEEFIDLIYSKVLPKKSIQDNIPMAMLETSMVIAEIEFLENINRYKKEISRLELEYPKLYNHMKNFFTKALDKKLRTKMISQHEKYLKRNQNSILDMMKNPLLGGLDDFEDFDDDDDFYDDEMFFKEAQTPIVREEIKIGRNDPCPCGSGKKYKKCCGNV